MMLVVFVFILFLVLIFLGYCDIVGTELQRYRGTEVQSRYRVLP